MTEEQAGKLLAQNLRAVYGYACARLYDKQDAEDLASEILCEVIAAAPRLRQEDAFWGYVWRTAENTFRKRIRRERLMLSLEEHGIDEAAQSPEEILLEREEKSAVTAKLRRELSLLRRAQREICIGYYIDHKSCRQIAEERTMTEDTVKYHLHAVRKKLKEGITMTRIPGERSYHPGNFHLGFWGDTNHYQTLFDRKLPGAIVSAVYDVPMTAEELSLEVGVPMPYLEDELDILEAAGILTERGGRYTAKIVILHRAWAEAVRDAAGSLCRESMQRILPELNTLLPEFRRLPLGCEFDADCLKIAMLNIAAVLGYESSSALVPSGAQERLPLGGYGFLYGIDFDETDNRHGSMCMQVYNRRKNAWFSAENYRVLEGVQQYSHEGFAEKAEAMCAAILGETADRENESIPQLIESGCIRCTDGRLEACFPVFDTEGFAAVRRLLEPASEETARCMEKVTGTAAALLEKEAPSRLRENCRAAASVHCRLETAAMLMEALLRDGGIVLPREKSPLCIWGVRV